VKILVVGLNHQIQRADILSGGDDIEKLEHEQKVHFAEYLARVIEERGVGFIGEEAQHGVALIGQRLAADLNCRHGNVEMPTDVRETRRIPADYTRQDRPYTSEQRATWHAEREAYMVEQVLGNGSCESVVVLCGREHVEPLAGRFRDAAHSVETFPQRTRKDGAPFCLVGVEKADPSAPLGMTRFIGKWRTRLPGWGGNSRSLDFARDYRFFSGSHAGEGARATWFV